MIMSTKTNKTFLIFLIFSLNQIKIFSGKIPQFIARSNCIGQVGQLSFGALKRPCLTHPGILQLQAHKAYIKKLNFLSTPNCDVFNQIIFYGFPFLLSRNHCIYSIWLDRLHPHSYFQLSIFHHCQDDNPRQFLKKIPKIIHPMQTSLITYLQTM